MNSSACTRRKIWIVFCFPLLLIFCLLTFLAAPTSRAAVNRQPAGTSVVQGVLRVGQSAQIWLGLTPEFADAQIKVIAEWDRLFPAANGLNFFIFDDQQLRRLTDGRTSFSAIALAAGNPRFELTTPDNTIGAGFKATGWASYALVLVNESALDAAFTLRVTNAFIVDTSAQVTVLDETAVPPSVTALTATIQPPTAFLTTPGLITTTALFTTWALPAPAAAVVVTPAAIAPITTPTVITDPLSISAFIPVPAAITTTQPITLIPLARTGLGQKAQLAGMSGALSGATTQQILRIKPIKAKGQILLRLVVDESATTTLDATVAPNFWVFDEAGFSQYLTGSAPASIAVSAGKRVFRSATNERAAGFRTSTIEPYTVVIYSEATWPVSYTFRVEGAQVLESVYLP